jgi:predicted deacylase
MRVIGARRSAAAGPTVLLVGGIHGNEPAGVHAAGRLLARLEGLPLRGEVHAFRGNVGALAVDRRFLARDLNRQWTPELMARAAGESDPEALELVELRAELDRAAAAARGPVFLLDLHTTSAAGVPFGLIGDDARQRRFGAALGVPMIVGLEARLHGVLSGYLGRLGAVTVAVEGGQHRGPESARNLDAILLCAVAAAGLVAPEDLPDLAAARAELARAAGDLPPLIEVLERHAVTPEDNFRMEPGFANIARVRSGELLARDRRGEIRAPADGLVLLPLYQAQGEDGFFLGRAT